MRCVSPPLSVEELCRSTVKGAQPTVVLGTMFGWGRPINLGAVVNSPSNEIGAAYLLGQAGIQDALYFSSTKPGGLGSGDIYESDIPAGGSFGAAVDVTQLNSAFNESCFTLSRDHSKFRETGPKQRCEFIRPLGIQAAIRS